MVDDLKDVNKDLKEDRDVVVAEKDILAKKIEHLSKELNII